MFQVVDLYSYATVMYLSVTDLVELPAVAGAHRASHPSHSRQCGRHCWLGTKVHSLPSGNCHNGSTSAPGSLFTTQYDDSLSGLLDLQRLQTVCMLRQVNYHNDDDDNKATIPKILNNIIK